MKTLSILALVMAAIVCVLAQDESNDAEILTTTEKSDAAGDEIDPRCLSCPNCPSICHPHPTPTHKPPPITTKPHTTPKTTKPHTPPVTTKPHCPVCPTHHPLHCPQCPIVICPHCPTCRPCPTTKPTVKPPHCHHPHPIHGCLD